jgi:hypothetical protein
MPRPVGALERSFAAVTIGMARDQRSRELALRDTQQGIHEQTVHLPISGEATNLVSFLDCDVSWEFPFLYAPQQTQFTHPTPHFTYGFEETIQVSQPVRYSAHVVRWAINDSDWFTGAVVRVFVDAPNTPANGSAIPYSAIAHLSFVGYSTMPEGDEFLT